MHKIKLFEGCGDESIIDLQREVNQFLEIKSNDIEVIDIKFNDMINEKEWFRTIMVHYKLKQ